MSKKSAQSGRSERVAAVLQDQRARERRRNLLITGAVVAVALVALLVAFLAARAGDTSGDAGDAPRGVDGYAVPVGSADAPTTLRIYEDPQCPICREFEAAVGEQLATAIEGGDVRVEYQIVSFLDQASANEYSSRAANALMAVQDTAGPEAFAAMHATLFQTQPAEGTAGPDNDQLVAWAVDAGAPESEVRPLIEDGVFDQFVVNSTDRMSRDGVTGTPTVLIDGEPAGDTPAAQVQAVLELLG